MTGPLRALAGVYRDAFGGLPATTWLLCTAAFLNRCGSMVVPLLGPYLKADFALQAQHAGFVIGLYGAGAFFGSWLGGRLTDRIGPVRLQVLALSASAVWMLLMTQLHSLWTVVPAVFVLGVCNDAFRPGSNTAAAVSAPPELRRKALSLNRFALNLGWAFGPTIGGYLVLADYAWMFVADGLTCGLAAAWLWIKLRHFTPFAPGRGAVVAAGGLPTPLTAADGAPVAAMAHSTARGPLRDGAFLWLMAANLLVVLAFMQYFTTGPRVFVDLGFTEAHVGWFLAINPLLITAFEMPVVHGLRAVRALPVIAVGSAVVGLGYLCMLLPGGVLPIVLAMVVVAGGELLQMPMLGAHVNDLAPDHRRGAYNGAYGMCFTLALVLAPVLGGLVYDHAGATTLWLSCGALGVLGAAMFALAPARTGHLPGC